MLRKALAESGCSVVSQSAEFDIHLVIDTVRFSPEAFCIVPKKNRIIIRGADGRGIIYGALALAEDIRNGVRIRDVKARKETAKLPFRAIKFDLPWDTYRHSYALDLHQETCAKPEFWEAFLDMMSANRFNTLTLWNLHPYPFMIKPRNFPEASPWNDEQMQAWQNLFHAILGMAAERGIETYLIPFNIFVSPEFAKAHKVALNNLEHHHYVQGDTSEIIKRYTQECVAQVLQEYPELSGMGLTLGEGMGGMTPQERENWMRETIIEGMRLADRKSKLIHRIPFSGSTASLGATTIEMEQITRQGIEQEADLNFIEKPVWASMKFNWSHAHSTPRLIKVHGGRLYGTYFDPEPTKYRIIWTVRNEDFFCLRWGVADFVRAHIKTNTHPYVGGYFVGSETYIPAKDYFTKPDIDVDWDYAFERQWLFYKLWGRLLYDPDTPDAVFRQEFIRRYGAETEVLFEAFALAGKTPLRLASSFDCTWDFTLYSEGFLALDPPKKRVDYISVNRQIHQPPLDTSLISVKEYVNTILAGQSFQENQITPIVLADQLDQDCRRALKLVEDIDYSKNTALMFEVSDIKTWAHLGLFFSEKLRGAVALQSYRISGKVPYKRQAVRHLKKALQYWDEVIAITRPIYNDMPLVHYSEQDGKSWRENDHLRFHWRLLRPEIVRDIETAKNARVISSPK
ncbi:MAG: hypothetical protein ACP5FZ_04890 [Fidelibacterota bacterium]